MADRWGRLPGDDDYGKEPEKVPEKEPEKEPAKPK